MTGIDFSKIGIIILAAGQSKRFGTPKQLLKFENQTLIRRTAETALHIEAQIIVVLGANADLIKPEIADLPLEIVINEIWQSGMSSSLKTGLLKLLEIVPQISAVILLLCDQPLIDEKLILRLVEKQKTTGKSIVACEYADTTGVPAIFARNVFDDLLNLQGDQGARFLIENRAADTAHIAAPEAVFDIDTPEDFARLTAV